MQNNWLESVLTYIDAFSNAYKKNIDMVAYQDMRQLKGKVVQELMLQYIVDRKMNLERMLEVIDSANVVSFKKEEMKC